MCCSGLSPRNWTFLAKTQSTHMYTISETVEGGTMIAIANHSFYHRFHCLATSDTLRLSASVCNGFLSIKFRYREATLAKTKQQNTTWHLCDRWYHGAAIFDETELEKDVFASVKAELRMSTEYCDGRHLPRKFSPCLEKEHLVESFDNKPRPLKLLADRKNCCRMFQ